MSADNGIYIAKFPDGYRVIEAQAIENIDYFPEDSPEWQEENKDYWEKAKLFTTWEEALAHANMLYDECWICEYGVVNLGERHFWGNGDSSLTSSESNDRKDIPVSEEVQAQEHGESNTLQDEER